jgi:hypothetical protein
VVATTLLTLPLEPVLLLLEIVQAEPVPGMALPVTANGTAGLPLMEAIAELTGRMGEPLAHLGEQPGQPGRVRRQFGAIEAWGIGHQGPRCQGKQLHMAGGVAPPLQTT